MLTQFVYISSLFWPTLSLVIISNTFKSNIKTLVNNTIQLDKYSHIWLCVEDKQMNERLFDNLNRRSISYWRRWNLQACWDPRWRWAVMSELILVHTIMISQHCRFWILFHNQLWCPNNVVGALDYVIDGSKHKI